jgi:hypothetical protein
MVYYVIPGSIQALVADGEASQVWLAENGSPEDPQEMLVVSYVKAFNIPKEDFVSAIEEDRQACINLEQDLNDEMWELPNADIIYTFDNDIINYYYRRA